MCVGLVMLRKKRRMTDGRRMQSPQQEIFGTGLTYDVHVSLPMVSDSGALTFLGF